MNLPRTVRLNALLRHDMATAIHHDWRTQHPRPTVSRPAQAEELKALDAWKQASDDYRAQTETVLGTFRTLNELAEQWPQIVKYVPAYVIDPAKHFSLPKLPRKKAA